MPLDDATLLKRWTAMREADVFNEIVDRFADQVYHTCHRILRNETDAEEVAQECFLQLVRTSGDVRSSLGGWLHGVATNKSRERIRSDVNRRARERAYSDLGAQCVEAGWDDIQEYVDGAIEALPKELREAVVAHYIGRKTHGEVAVELGITRRAVSYRIERGVAAIRKELARSGVVLSAAALGPLFAAESSAAPLSLKATLGKLAIAAGPAPVGGGPIAGGSLLGSLMLMNTKTIATTGLLVLVATGIFFALTRAPRESAEPPAQAGESEIVAVADEPTVGSMPEPLTNPDDEGVSEADGEATPTLEDLLALSRTELEKALEHYPPIEDPVQHASVSGVVLDQDGYAVSGAAITLVPVHYWGKLPGAGELARTTVSGSDGAYRIEGIASGGPYWVCASKPGFGTASRGASRETSIDIKAGTSATVDFTMQTGPSVHGRVLTNTGKPVPNALVHCVSFAGPRSMGIDERRAAKTDAQGQFALGFREDERGFVTTLRVQSAKHGAATFPEVLVQDGHTVDLRLTAPAVVRGTVKKRSGEVVAGARLNFYARKNIEIEREDGSGWGNPIFGGYFIAVADEAGRFATELDAGMDYDAEVKVAVFHGSQKRDEIAALVAGETRAYNPVLESNTINVRATIVGQQSGEPFESYVPVVAVAIRDGEEVGYSEQDGVDAVRFALQPEPGEYTFQARYMFNREMAGDHSKPYQLDGGDEIEIDLNVPDPQSFTLRAVEPQGSPVAGGWVRFTTEDSGTYNPHIQTNAEGRLDKPLIIAPEMGARLYLELGGYAAAWAPVFDDQSPGTVHPEVTLVLWPGAGFEGDLVGQDGQPLAETPLTLTVTNLTGQTWPLETTTDANGHFTVVDGAPADVVEVTITSRGGADAWVTGEVRLRANAITGLGELTAE